MAVDKIFEKANLNNVPVALKCVIIDTIVETRKPDSSSSDETNQAAVGLIVGLCIGVAVSLGLCWWCCVKK